MIEEGLLPTFEDNWRTAKQGSWTFADDGRVLQVLKKKDIKHPMDDKPWNEKWAPEGYVLTCVGSYVCKKKYWMDTDFSLRENRHSFGIPRTAETKKRSVRKRCSASELGFVMDVIAGLPIIIAYSNHFTVKNKSNKQIMNKALRLIQEDRCMRLLKTEIDTAAGKLGVTVESVMAGVIAISKDKKTGSMVKLDCQKTLGGWIGMDEIEQNNAPALGTGGFNSKRLGEGVDHGGRKEIKEADTVDLTRPDHMKKDNNASIKQSFDTDVKPEPKKPKEEVDKKDTAPIHKEDEEQNEGYIDFSTLNDSKTGDQI